MADERDLELLDDYLTNRMSEQGRSAFEQKLKADPDLQHEFALQKRLIQGIKGARVTELKSMLNNVSVPPAGIGNTVATKIILGMVATVIIAGAAYIFLKQQQAIIPTPQIKTEDPIPSSKPTESKVLPQTKSLEEEPAQQHQPVEIDKNQTSAGTEHSKPSLARKPDPLSAPAATKTENLKGPVLDVFTPEAEAEESTSTDGKTNTDNQNNLTPVASGLVVETDRNNGRYTFHYQFRGSKLFLYGPFEKNLYEIMEFFADESRTVFLYYNDRYYLLAGGDEQVRPLSAISDGALLRKLKEYRSSK